MSDKSTVKLPEFIEDSPQTWWLTCEAVFETKKLVKDIDRYYHLVASLPSNITRTNDVEADVDSSYLFRMMLLMRLPKNIQSTHKGRSWRPLLIQSYSTR